MKGLRLNTRQEKAIKHGKGPLLIVAGAGTGKTTVICERIKHLILSGAAKPSEILALTFTQKAAEEMQTRVDVAMPYGYTQMWISTFHSFCDRILRQEALNIGISTKYKLLTEAESVGLLRENIFKFNLDYFLPLGNPNKFILGMLDFFSHLEDEDVDAKQFSNWVERRKGKSDEEKLEIKKLKELSSAYDKYEDLKIKNDFLDFGDLIVKTLKLLRQRKNILSKYRKQFKFILVDEFQDTNYAQNELVKILAGKNGNLTVVADDDQAIYRFRGASISNVIQFKKNFPKTKIVTLNKNYRSSQEILDKAYGLIQYNNPDRLEIREKIDKKLIATKKIKGKGEIKFIHTDRVENEAEEVAKEIYKLTGKDKKTKKSKYNYGDIAILVRANNHSDPFVRALGRYAIPHQFLGPGRLFKRPEVLDLISYLRVLEDPSDSSSFYRILSMDVFNLSVRDIAFMGSFSKKKNISLFEAAEKINKIAVSKKTKKQVKDILKLITSHLKAKTKESAGQILFYFVDSIGLFKKLLESNKEDEETKAKNISKFFDKLKTYEVDHEDSSVSAVVSWLELSSELGESPLASSEDWARQNAVNILSIHSAKGLEFPVVFLVNLVSQRFPSVERKEQIEVPKGVIKEILPFGDYHLQEERRLFYVGLTRAKEKLYLTAADYYGEGKREKYLSPFIYETLGNKIYKDLPSIIARKKGITTGYEQINIPAVKIKNDSLKIDYLSVSQIETFNICPLHFKLRHLLGIPTAASASQSFGITIHETMKLFYERIQKQKATDSLIYECLKECWQDEGYVSKTHEKKFFEKAKFYLSGYLKYGYQKNITPVLLEEKFNLPLKQKNERMLKIGGKIDRVDLLSNGTMEIIDYKTGATIATQKEVDNDLQLTFYALAATKIPNKPFGITPENIILSFYFFDTQEKITTKRSKEQLEKAVEDIFKKRREIENSDFKCSGGFLCKNCEYKLLCNVRD